MYSDDITVISQENTQFICSLFYLFASFLPKPTKIKDYLYKNVYKIYNRICTIEEERILNYL